MLTKTFCLTATLSTAVIALLPFAPKIALGQIPTDNHPNQGSLDLPSYCKQKYGTDATATLQKNNALAWKCMAGGQAQDISFEEACSMQYGAEARPAMDDFDNIGSWHCRLKSNAGYQGSGS